jgi:beta-N-acetylhexosaminidase
MMQNIFDTINNFIDYVGGMMGLDNNQDIDSKIGSMLIFGFLGDDIYSNDNKDFLENLQANNIGSVILFTRNISSSDNLKNLNGDILEENSDAFIFVDQEGGRVQRLKFNQYKSAKQITENHESNEIQNYEEAKTEYGRLSKELKEHNINVNFGPVVDVDNIYPCPVIGGMDRSYSKDPEIVSKYAKIFIDAHHDNEIFTCLKHFPGHGSARNDSHHGLTDVTETFSETELKPFYDLIEKGKADMIMTAHIINENYDKDYPATMSKNTLYSLLRDKGYNGVIVSDDLCMGAIAQNYSIEDSIVKSINAGCDMLIISNNPLANKNAPDFKMMSATAIINIIKNAVKAGMISKSQIEESYNRITKLKNKFER